MLFFIFVFVYIKFLSEEAIPVLFELGLSSLSEHFSFDLLRILVIVYAEVIQNWGGRAEGVGLSTEELSGRLDFLVCNWHCAPSNIFHLLVDFIWHPNGFKSSGRAWIIQTIFPQFLHKFCSLLFVNLGQLIWLEVGDRNHIGLVISSFISFFILLAILLSIDSDREQILLSLRIKIEALSLDHIVDWRHPPNDLGTGNLPLLGLLLFQILGFGAAPVFGRVFWTFGALGDELFIILFEAVEVLTAGKGRLQQNKQLEN